MLICLFEYPVNSVIGFNGFGRIFCFIYLLGILLLKIRKIFFTNEKIVIPKHDNLFLLLPMLEEF